MTIVDRAPAPHAPRLPTGLDTPSLVVDLDVVEANARRMAEARRRGRRAPAARQDPQERRPRPAPARRRRRGGITVGTLGEAEAMVDGGIDDVFVGYPLWADGPKAERLRRLHERCSLRSGWTRREAAGAARAA